MILSEKIKEYLNYFRLFYLIAKPYRFDIVLILFLLFLNAVLESIGIAILLPILDLLIGKNTNNIVVRYIDKFFKYFDIQMILTNVLIFFFILILIKNIFKFLQVMINANFTKKIKCNVAEKIFKNILEVEYSYFHNSKKGDILYAITGTTGSIGALIVYINEFFLYFTLACCYFILLVIISFKLSLISILLSIIIVPLMKKILKLTHKSAAKLSESSLNFTSFFVEIIDSIQIIKSYALESYAINFFCKKWNETLKHTMWVNINSGILSFVSEPVRVIIVISIIVISSRYLNLEFSGIVIFLFILYRFIPILQIIAGKLNEALKQLPNVRIAAEALDKNNKKFRKDGYMPITIFEKSIVFQDVNFSYNNVKSVLNNINFEIKKNKITAVVGSTGSGKSTLISLILRLYDPTNGTINVDGIDIRSLKIKDWIDILAFVPQDVFLFNVSIKENIKFGKLNASEDEIVSSAKIANAHDFIMRLPDRYDTIIGERGVKLSGGQKQMIALARAIIKEPQILILDEATSSLDNESESLIQDSINKISSKITIITIAHRLSTVINSNEIIVIDNGTIAEKGTHKELVELKGKYADYYNHHLRK